MDQTLFILGVNHQTAPVAVRERLAFADDEIVGALARLKQCAPALAEAALISTCNRVEIIGVTGDNARAAAEATGFLASDRGVASEAFAPALYNFAGREAARHLFRVGATLDSMVVGEPQILGQLKIAYAQAVEAGSAGLVLHRAFHKAFAVAKRVRKATLIGHGAVSVSSAAVSLAGKIFDTLADKTVMLMGAGKMAELTARNLKRLGIESLLITSRTFDNAVALARDLGGTAVPLDSFKPYLKIADVVIGSLAATRPVLGPEEFETIVRERPRSRTYAPVSNGCATSSWTGIARGSPGSNQSSAPVSNRSRAEWSTSSSIGSCRDCATATRAHPTVSMRRRSRAACCAASLCSKAHRSTMTATTRKDCDAATVRERVSEVVPGNIAR